MVAPVDARGIEAASQPTVSGPRSADLPGDYSVSLVVTDDIGHASARQIFSFSTTGCGAAVRRCRRSARRWR